MLGCVALVRQSSLFDGLFLNALPSFDDGLVPSEVDVGGREVAKALVVAPVIVVLHEGADLRFQVSRQVVVFEQDAELWPEVDGAVKSCWPMACLYRSLRFGEEYLPVSALLVDKT